MQAITRNLADPGVLGINASAAFAVVAMMLAYSAYAAGVVGRLAGDAASAAGVRSRQEQRVLGRPAPRRTASVMAHVRHPPRPRNRQRSNEFRLVGVIP